MPVLALHGDADTAASARGAEALVDAAKARGARIDFVLYDGLDHGFRQKGGQSDLTNVIKDIRRWLEHGTK